jgi:MT0933-like antitoxin protein
VPAKAQAVAHKDQVGGMLNQVGGIVDQASGGKFHDQIGQATSAAEQQLGR